MRILLVSTALLLAFCAPEVARADKAAAKRPSGLAHLKLSGGMAESAPGVDSFAGAAPETFKTKIDRLEKAAADKEISALVLEIDGLSVGWGKLNELSQAIARIRKSGKKVFAYLESGGTKDYLLALACDEVAMPESGTLMLTGVRAEVTFYKGLFAKLGIVADMIQMGDFKGAAEPYTRDSLSDANRKQLTGMVDDFYEKEIVARIVHARSGKKLSADKVKKLIDDGPYSAREAHKVGLIDRLAYFDDYPGAIKTSLQADDVKLVKDYGKQKAEEMDLLSLSKKLIFGGGKSTTSSRGSKVAVIYATGAIVSGKSSVSLLGGQTCGSDTIIEAIRQAENDKSVKAIVLRVDSPGGSALASDLMWNELKKCKKPVLASMSDVAASGGYYISMPAARIYAEPGTITGSIGVVGGKLSMRGLWDKAGVKSESISRGTNSGILSSDEPFTASEKKRMTDLMKETYDQFLNKALEGRKKAGKKMTRDDLEKLAGGRIWTGRQAKENGLIDELGTLENAIADAAKRGGLPEGKKPELLLLPAPRNPLDSLLGSLGDLKMDGVKLDLSKLPDGLKDKLRGVDCLIELRREPVWLVLPYRLEVK